MGGSLLCTDVDVGRIICWELYEMQSAIQILAFRWMSPPQCTLLEEGFPDTYDYPHITFHSLTRE